MPALLTRLALLVAIAWAGAALWIDGPPPRALGIALAALFLFSALGAVAVMSIGRAVWLVGAGVVAVAIWWTQLEPRNDRLWAVELACPPLADRRGELVTLYNLRAFDWRWTDDFDVRWETRAYDLGQVRGLDLFLSQRRTEGAHPILSWEFADGQHLAISIEPRREQGEEYSALEGCFRRYELAYVAGDERDLIGLRATCRGEDVRLYRLRTPPDRARRLLIEYLGRINALATHPAWYHALADGAALEYGRTLLGRTLVDWRVLADGHLDELLYDEGLLDTSVSMEGLRERSLITNAARAARGAPDFSEQIRAGLPPRPSPAAGAAR